MLARLQNDVDARAIFDILNEDRQIYAAILATENGKPALSASIKKIEDYVLKMQSNFFASNFERQAVGRMQKFVLAPFGYIPNDLKKSVNSKIFTVATCYKKDESNATMIIKVTAEEKKKLKKHDADKIARLRKAFVDDGDFAAMIELSHIYIDIGEQDKADELIDIYMKRGDYLWLAEAEEAMIRQKNS